MSTRPNLTSGLAKKKSPGERGLKVIREALAVSGLTYGQ